ncbi:ferritin-like domain-containing protein [Haloechinothrix sp. YIM 98757]|uniref:Ferritin-like domain-containing protein n=1 Tax=Haloechinothrix aidingensis TaxID=2752311 RepID=A0A838AAD8_9PSEU|nr:ferritin-like domain-containing protein [Haloechinothrix aidingensis]MBA0126203.1 ferritin-like domain-containing protein [Haloechinothrix aidingensis]
MAVDFEDMLRTIKDKQWSLADIDWDAPGAETITDEQWPKLRQFMSDLVWIENIGARGFAALARQAPNDTVKDIYTYFHAEEQKHANAELALMKRWGMLDDGETPAPNVNIRMAIRMLDRHGDRIPLTGLATLIPMLECALDGALVKFLLEEVDDPLCHEVFRHINSDESRHIAVDFQVLDLVGAGRTRRLLIEAAAIVQPHLLLGLLVVFVPLLNKMRDNIVAMGLPEQKLYNAVKRYVSNGDRSANTKRIPAYHLFKQQARMVVDRSHPYHRYLADPLVKVTGRIPDRLLGKNPTWSKELTHEPVDR